jgi:hypothetical protein
MNQLLSNQNESKSYFFTARELERLTAYRAAFAASFYTDDCEQPTGSADAESFRLEDLILTSAYAA